MLFLFVCHLFLPILLINSIQIPFIDNVILNPGYSSNSTLIFNQTCGQCLCISSLSYAALNCFSNNTCQLFFTFPSIYRLEMTAGARLYFPQQQLPNASQCCMPDINDLLNKLKLATITFGAVLYPRDMVIDDYGYLVTVEMKANHLDRFDATNLTRISQSTAQSNSPRTIAYHNGAYYIASNNNPMAVIDSGNLTALNNITLTSVNGPRSIIFLNDGQTMVVSSINNNSLVFFNRSSVSPTQYAFFFYQSVNCSGPHGLWYINDSFFYVTSYKTNSIYSYSANGVNTSWTEKLVFTSVEAVNSTLGVTHVTIDECGRFWLSLETDTTLIYDQQGNFLGNFTIAGAGIYDIKIMDNYLMYFSDANMNRTIRIEPNIQCPFED